MTSTYKYSFVDTHGEELDKNSFTYVRPFDINRKEKGGFKAAIIDGKFIILEHKRRFIIAIWKIEAPFKTLVHANVATQLKTKYAGESIFIGAGIITWNLKNCRTTTIPDEPVVRFDSSTCREQFGYDRPPNSSLQRELAEVINNYVMYVYLTSLIEI